MADEDIQQQPQNEQTPRSQGSSSPDTHKPLRQADSIRNIKAFISGALGAVCLSIVAMQIFDGPLDSDTLFIAVLIILPLMGPCALVLGILGIRHRTRHPSDGGIGYAIVGIVAGIIAPLWTLGFLGALANSVGVGSWK
jgi:uncharacterized membrane protein HdeD (DUF308 family)